VGNLEEHDCNSEMNHNYDNTLYNIVAHKNEIQLNCSVPFHPPTVSKVTGKAIDVCNNSEMGRNALNNLLSLKNKGPDLPNNTPCAGMNVFLGQPDVGKNTLEDQGFIRLYLKSEVKVKSVILYYDFTTFAADIGGYIGMFLGISLVDFTIKCNSALFNLFTIKLKQIYGNEN
jgi:hypothetical protein